MHWVIISVLVPPIRVPRRLTTGRLINLLTFFAQHTKLKHNRWLKAGVSIVETSSSGYLANAAGPVPLVLDLRVAHDRVGSSSDPALNGHLRYPNNLDKSLNDSAADKIRPVL